MKKLIAVRQLLDRSLSWPVWLAFFYAGLFLPVICFLMTLGGTPDPPSWQSGALSDKLAFTLGGRAAFAFYPLLLYPMTCLALVLFHETRFATKRVVRFGIYTGVPVAGWYGVMLGIYLAGLTSWASWAWFNIVFLALLAIAVPLGLWGLLLLLLWARRAFGLPWKAVVIFLVVLAFVVVPAFVLATGHSAEEYFSMFGVLPSAVFFFSIFLAPFLSFWVYLITAFRLVWRYPRPPRFGILELFAVLSWLGAYFAACRWAVLRSLEEYATLPVEAPEECYVATAAAHGHEAVVRSWVVARADGTIVRVNRQLMTLKAGELLLSSVFPHLHALVRRVYNCIGPVMARRLANPIFADLAYVGLKPAEWCCYAGVAILLGQERKRINSLYRSQL